MILADTSAWVEYLRATGSPVHRKLHQLIDADAGVATTDVVVMELLAGVTKDEQLTQLRRMLLRFEHLPVDPLDDFEPLPTCTGSADAAARRFAPSWTASSPPSPCAPARPCCTRTATSTPSPGSHPCS